MKNFVACICLALVASACGWQVRGAMDLPKNLSQLYLSAVDSRGALVTELRQLLTANRVSLVDDESQANYVLNILEQKKERRSAGVGGDALSSSYEITLKVDYEIRLKNSLATDQATAISVRSFNYNTATINSATQEENLLDQEMRRDIAQQMLRRLNAVVNNPPKEKATHKDAAPAAVKASEEQNGKAAP